MSTSYSEHGISICKKYFFLSSFTILLQNDVGNVYLLVLLVLCNTFPNSKKYVMEPTFAPKPFFFFWSFWNFSHPPTYYPSLPPINLFTYIFKLKVDSSPSTYSPIIWFACFNDVFKQCGLDLTIIYVSIRLLEFWVMETTNIYDFLHLLSLITIKPNMDFWGDFAFAHTCHNTFFIFYFSLKENGERLTSKDQSKK